MATSSFLGGEQLPKHVKGKDTNALGPSDNSDSGSDAQGAYGGDELSSDSDAEGTGERSAPGRGFDGFNADIMPDHIEGELDDPDSDGGQSYGQDEARDVESLAADEADDEDEPGE